MPQIRLDALIPLGNGLYEVRYTEERDGILSPSWEGLTRSPVHLEEELKVHAETLNTDFILRTLLAELKQASPNLDRGFLAAVNITATKTEDSLGIPMLRIDNSLSNSVPIESSSVNNEVII